jgi:hypothetical protein
MNLDDLNDPKFLEYVRGCFPDGLVEPDKQDLDPHAVARTDEEAAELYREAQTRQLMRMWEQWKAGQN